MSLAIFFMQGLSPHPDHNCRNVLLRRHIFIRQPCSSEVDLNLMANLAISMDMILLSCSEKFFLHIAKGILGTKYDNMFLSGLYKLQLLSNDLNGVASLENRVVQSTFIIYLLWWGIATTRRVHVSDRLGRFALVFVVVFYFLFPF